MCRAGGRRCPSSRNASRAAETARKALYRARRRLAAAREIGDAEAVARAEVTLAAAHQRLADARAQQQGREGRDRDDQDHRPQARPAEERTPATPPPPERDTAQATPGTGHTPQSGGAVMQIADQYRVDSDGRLARLDGRPTSEADLAEARQHLRTTAEQLSIQAERLARQADAMTGPAAAGAPSMRAGAQQMRTQADRMRQALQRLHSDPNPPTPTTGAASGDQHVNVGRVIHNTTGPGSVTSVTTVMGAAYGPVTINGRTWHYPGRALQVRGDGTVVDANTGELLNPTA